MALLSLKMAHPHTMSSSLKRKHDTIVNDESSDTYVAKITPEKTGIHSSSCSSTSSNSKSDHDSLDDVDCSEPGWSDNEYNHNGKTAIEMWKREKRMNGISSSQDDSSRKSPIELDSSSDDEDELKSSSENKSSDDLRCDDIGMSGDNSDDDSVGGSCFLFANETVSPIEYMKLDRYIFDLKQSPYSITNSPYTAKNHPLSSTPTKNTHNTNSTSNSSSNTSSTNNNNSASHTYSQSSTSISSSDIVQSTKSSPLSSISTNTFPLSIQPAIKKTGGRKKGVTNVCKTKNLQNEKNAKYKIVTRYAHEIKNYVPGTTKLFKKDIFSVIHDEERLRFGLDKSFKLPYATCLARIRRNNLNGDGMFRPLLFVEDDIVKMFLSVSRMRCPLNMSNGLNLINDLIAGTIHQTQLIQWKLKHNIYYENENELGRVSKSFFRNFMKRNGHRLRSKVGRRYAFDRSNFTSYLNFRDMYDQIEQVLVEDCNIASRYPEPVWMNQKGEIVMNENESVGLKCNINITRPDMCITLDEVGCNLTQEKDGAKGGELFLCGVDEVPYQTSATKGCHFTCLGLTTLSGEGVMCVVIIQGKKEIS